MIINCDAKALEWYAGTFLAKDKVAKQEILNGVDQHTHNQTSFNLPSRLIAKKFVFRLMYGGSAYSYANDPEFKDISSSQDYWQKVIDSFYSKYTGFYSWHTQLMQTVTRSGKIVMPTGRVYNFVRDSRGNWPQTTIKNYPVQGLGADIMAIARVSFFKRFKDAGIKGLLVNTVHDSIVCDVEKGELDKVATLFFDVFRDLPKNFEKVFKVEFDLPLYCEVSFGDNMKELTEYK